MWALLSDPGHAAGFDDLGEAYGPLRRLVVLLAGREYAGQVYAFRAAASFNLTTAPSADVAGVHGRIGIEYDPDRRTFQVGYGERAPPIGRPRHRAAPSRACAPGEVGAVVDDCVRLLVESRPLVAEPIEQPAAQTAVQLVMLAAMLVFMVFSALMWAGLPVGRMAVVIVGIALLATSLLLFGEALLPGWVRGNWGQARGRRTTIQMGRLVLLGAGFWFGAGGVAFLGYGWLTEYLVPGILAGFPIGFVLFMVGMRRDRRRLEAAWAIEDAQRTGAEPQARSHSPQPH